MDSLFILQSYGNTLGLQNTWEGLGWSGIALSAVALCIFFFALAYTLGKSLSLENVKRWALSEMLQVGASAILIVLLIQIVNYASFFTIAVLIGQGTTVECGEQDVQFSVLLSEGGSGSQTITGNPISFAKCRVQEKITRLDNMYQKIFDDNKGVEAAAAYCWSLSGVQVYCGDWYLHGEVENAHLLTTKITPLLMNLHGQYTILDYIDKNMLTIFLPLGILLRVFPLTRGAGGLLIATSIGFYFILPGFFILTDPSYARPSNDVQAVSQTKVFNACYPGFSGSSVLLTEVTRNLAATQGNLSLFSSKLANLTVGIMFYPFIALAITLVFVRSTAPIFGGDLGELTSMISKVL